MTHRLVRTLVARSAEQPIGTYLPMPLRQWVIDLYMQIDLIDSFGYFSTWLMSLDKLPAIYRRSGIHYEIAEHWAESVKGTPMDFFTAAATERKNWANIFIKVDTKNRQVYEDFWKWTGPNPYQVQIWLAEVIRKFYNALWAEHKNMLEDQRDPESHGQERPKKEDEEPEPEEYEAKSWQEIEQLERRLFDKERQEDARKQQEKSPISPFQ